MKCPGGCERVHHNSIKCSNFQKGVRNDEGDPISEVTLGHHPNCQWEGYINSANCTCKIDPLARKEPSDTLEAPSDFILLDPIKDDDDIKNPLLKNLEKVGTAVKNLIKNVNEQ